MAVSLATPAFGTSGWLIAFLVTCAIYWLLWRSYVRYFMNRIHQRAPGERAQRAELKKRMPKRVKAFERIVRSVLLCIITLAAFVVLLVLYAVVHSALEQPGAIALAFLIMSSAVVSIAPGMMISNGVSWLISPVRKANLIAMDGLPAASFRRMNLGLLEFWAWAGAYSFIFVALAVWEPWAH
jgi:hypothetical protein